MKALGNIFLTWRKGKGERRKIVGTIRRGSSSSVRFNYNLEAVQEAYKEGFSPYTDFPEIDKTYTDNVLEVFGQRLIKTDRSDINRFLDFWAINPKFKDDKYYMLAERVSSEKVQVTSGILVVSRTSDVESSIFAF